MLKERCESRRNGRAFITFHCECLANGIPARVLHSPKFEQAQKVLRVLSEWGMKPYRTEINLFHIGMRCGVQPDLSLLDFAHRVVIVDWKFRAILANFGQAVGANLAASLRFGQIWSP